MTDNNTPANPLLNNLMANLAKLGEGETKNEDGNSPNGKKLYGQFDFEKNKKISPINSKVTETDESKGDLDSLIGKSP